MGKKRKTKQNKSSESQKEKLAVSQFEYIKELADLKFKTESEREQNLFRQSSQMQTIFSFMSAAIFMAVGICVDFINSLSFRFYLVAVSIIMIFLIASLVFASLAQWRWKDKTFQDISEMKNDIINNPDWIEYTKRSTQLSQQIDLIGKVQAHKAKLNDRRVKFIMVSMICFYFSIISIVFSFVFAITIM